MSLKHCSLTTFMITTCFYSTDNIYINLKNAFLHENVTAFCELMVIGIIQAFKLRTTEKKLTQ